MFLVLSFFFQKYTGMQEINDEVLWYWYPPSMWFPKRCATTLSNQPWVRDTIINQVEQVHQILKSRWIFHGGWRGGSVENHSYPTKSEQKQSWIPTKRLKNIEHGKFLLRIPALHVHTSDDSWNTNLILSAHVSTHTHTHTNSDAPNPAWQTQDEKRFQYGVYCILHGQCSAKPCINM